MKLLLVFWLAAQSQQPPSNLARAAEQARDSGNPEAPALFRRALDANPRWEDGWWALGTLEYGNDHYPECREAFRQLVRLSPKSGPGATMLGLCEIGSHQDDQALIDLRHGQELGAGAPAIDKVAKYQLAKLYVRRGQFEPALSVIAQLAQTADEKPAYLSLAGVAALWKPVLPEEVPDTDRELVYLAGRAFWYAGARKAAAASEAIKELVARYPNSPGVHYLYGSFELRDNADRAVDQFLEELKIAPSHVGALSALAAEYLRRGEYAKGLPYARQLATILPDALASHALLGRLLAGQGLTEEGVRELEKARSIDPNHPQPHIALASLYAKLGRKQDAARERQEFLRLKDRDGGVAEP